MAKRGTGEGTIYFHEGRQLWCAQVHLGYADGKRQRKTIYGKTRKDVAEKLKVVLREQQQGKVRATRKKTVADFLDDWLRAVRPTIRARTYDSYESIVRVHLKPRVGHYQLEKLTPDHVSALLDAKREAGESPRQIQYIRGVLRQALNYGMRQEVIVRNVAALTLPPRVERPEIRVLTPEEARQLLDAAQGDRLEALYSVALAIGLRQGEALGLKWEDVDLDRATLQVRNSLQRIDGKLQLVQPKTDQSRRAIDLPATIVTSLRKHRLRQLEERLSSPEWDDSWGLIFCTPNGRPLEKSGLTKRFAKLLEKAGLPKMRFHDLRHSCASLLLAQGLQAKAIQGILGHSTISMTMDVYAHLMPAAKKEAAEIMDDVLTGRRR